MELKVGMYVRGSYYQYQGKIGKIIKNYQNELEIAYKDRIIKTTVNSFIDDNFDNNGKQYKASFNIIDLIETGDYINGRLVKLVVDTGVHIIICFSDDMLSEKWLKPEDIETIVTKEQFSQMEYRLGDK